MRRRLRKPWARAGSVPMTGVDIGSSSIKLAQVEPDGEGWRVRVTGVVDAPNGATEEAAGRVREFLKTHRVPRPWRAATALAGRDAEIRILDVPAGDPATFPQRVISAAEQVLPFGTDGTILDFFSLGRSAESGEKTERVLVAAAARGAIDERVQFLERAGMVPEVIELTPWALGRAARFLGNQPEDSPFGVLDLGHTVSTVVIFDRGGLFLSRSIRSGSKILTAKIRKELDLDWKRAEQLKGERGLTLRGLAAGTGGREDGGTMVAEILDDLFLPTLDHLTEEVEKSLAYYASESQGEMLELLILAGGGAKLRNLDVFLSERLGLAVRILGSSLDNEAAPGPGVDWPHMAEALGLSFRGLGSTTWKSLRGQGP